MHTICKLSLVEARNQATQEGVSNPHKHIRSEQNQLTRKWADRFSGIVSLNENKDWIAYCRVLGHYHDRCPKVFLSAIALAAPVIYSL